MENKFYVYAHQRLTDGKCFYIGKGTGNRAKDTNNRNKYWRNVAAKHGFKAVILVNNISEDKAFELEKEFIRQIGRENLVNLTDGGDGVSGLAHSEETRQKISKAKKGKKSPNFGKQHSAETRQKISKAKKGKQLSEEHRAKISKPVLQYTKNGQFLAKFNSISESSRVTGIRHGNISNCCLGKNKSAGGYVWKFSES